MQIAPGPAAIRAPADEIGVEATAVQAERIAPLLPEHRRNVSLSNLQGLNSILYVAAHGGKSRAVARRLGPATDTRSKSDGLLVERMACPIGRTNPRHRSRLVGYEFRNGSSLRRRDSATVAGSSDSFQQSAMMPSGRTNARPDGS